MDAQAFVGFYVLVEVNKFHVLHQEHGHGYVGTHLEHLEQGVRDCVLHRGL